jgi:two-component system chemotaxis sensor kinase CheA
MDQHETVFREEARELLTELESSLLDLENNPQDNELVSKIFRAMHTIKGSGAMFGFDKVAAFTHDIETVYDLLRNGKIAVSKELIDLTLASCDQIQLMVEGQEETEAGAAAKLTLAFKEFLPGAKGKPAKAEPLKAESLEPPPAEPTDKKVTYRIRFKPHADIFSRGTNITPLLMEMRRMGVCKITTQTDAVPDLAEINPENCYIYWDIMLTTNRGLDAVKDVFIFVEDECDLKIEAVDEVGADESNEYKKLGEILIERGDVSHGVVEKIMSTHKKIGEVLVAEGLVVLDKVQSALSEQQHVQEMREKTKATDSSATIRVPAVRLDRLVNMVGELVTVQSRLSQLAAQVNNADLVLVGEEVERLTAELRDNTMSIRMLPIGNTFSNFKRLVRDLSEELGKQINLVTEGAETELDKTVIEKLKDPLIHLIRNSIDHGIEQPAVREQKDKPKSGTIRLTAEHAGAHVLISIKDDGAGIDVEAIRRKAIERNIISQNDILTEKELYALIFAPGFSMAKTVTNVSGRGVGMDVVKKGIDGLNGSIVITSKIDVGTTITLKLPLTMAIIDGLLVRIAESFFVLPLSAIEECMELTREDVAQSHGRKIVHIRGEVVPYIPLRKRFRIIGDSPAIEQIIINRVGEERVGLVVDQVIGQHQTVIKNLGKFYRQIKEVSGATILGDGTVALIIDIPQLLQGAISEENQEVGFGSSSNNH